ncbi:MAG: hypothetical protein N2Z62_04205 [Rhodobacteraceae bacterium]|nr:hypothetical protein [Paracoccaceae bacterium]
MAPEPVTLLNTALPLGIIGTAGAVLPRLLVPAGTRSLARLAWVAGACVPLMLVFAAAVFLALRRAGGADLAGAFAAAPGPVLGELARSAAMSTLVWGPALALSALSLAQRIERLRGEDMARRQG